MYSFTKRQIALWMAGLLVLSSSGNLTGMLADAASSVTHAVTEIKAATPSSNNAYGDNTNITWSLDANGKLTFDGTGDLNLLYDWNGAKWVPSYPWGDPDDIKKIEFKRGITCIGDSMFSDYRNLTSVTFNRLNGITKIGYEAFSGCESLTSISLPSGLTEIGNGAFSGSGLRSIAIPSGVTRIGSLAFENCPNLASATVAETVTSIGAGAFSDCVSLSDVTLPDTLKDISDLTFNNCYSLTSISIPAGTESIGASAFKASGLTKAVIPSGVTSIGESAFYACSAMAAVTIPNSVTRIGSSAFSKCGFLSSVTLSKNLRELPAFAFYHCDNLTELTLPEKLTSIGESAFEDCARLNGISIPGSVTDIGTKAFSGCTELSGVIIPGSVTHIGADAFTNTGFYNKSSNWENGVLYSGLFCLKVQAADTCEIKPGIRYFADEAFRACKTCLKSVTLPSSVVSIGPAAFQGFTDLASVTLASGLKTIGDWAFSGCDSLGAITIPDTVTTIGDYAFDDCMNLTSVSIQEGVTTIGMHAFSKCVSLTRIAIPDSVTSLGSYAFSGCSLLTTATLSHALTSIEAYTFNGCLELKTLTIPDSVTTIGYGAFNNCQTLSSLTLSSHLTTIGGEAFSDCISLTALTVPFGVTSIGDRAFYRSKLQMINIPSSVTELGFDVYYGTAFYKNTSNWTNNALYCDHWLLALNNQVSGVYQVADGTVGIAGPALRLSSVSELYLPDSLRYVGNYAFCNCRTLTSIQFPAAGVTEIGDYAFSNDTNLTSITYAGLSAVNGTAAIPTGVTKIGFQAFNNCASLTKVILPDSVTQLGVAAFNECTSLQTVTLSQNLEAVAPKTFYNCSRLGVITIPNSVTEIGESAFYGCSLLTRATISNRAARIGMQAFYNCKKLTNLKLPGRVTEIGSAAFLNCTALTDITIPSNVAEIGDYAFGFKESGTEFLLTSRFYIQCCPNTGGDAYAQKNGIYYQLIDQEDELLEKFQGAASGDIVYIRVPKNETVSAGIMSAARTSMDFRKFKLEIESAAEAKANWMFDRLTIGAEFNPMVQVDASIPELTQFLEANPLKKSIRAAQILFSQTDEYWPGEAALTLDLSECGKFTDGETLYLYSFDPATNDFTLELTAVPENGKISFPVTHAINGLILNQELAFAPAGISVSGSLTIKGDTSGLSDVSIQIFSGESEVPVTVPIEDGGYSIAGLADGIYTMKVSKPNYTPRSYSFTVSGGIAEDVDIVLHLRGDIDGDGAANILDLEYICQHIRRVVPLSGYALACADVLGNDGLVNAKDLTRICDHIRGVKRLWD